MAPDARKVPLPKILKPPFTILNLLLPMSQVVVSSQMLPSSISQFPEEGHIILDFDSFKYPIIVVCFMRVEINDYIVVDSNICHGQPTFKGTRIMVSIVLEMLEDGASFDEILEAYPSLTKKHIKASLQFAAQLTERSFELVPA